MTHLTRRLIAAGIGIALLALPLTAGAEGNETHRIFFSEDNTARTYNVATYGMVELTTIEEIANGELLGYDTIRFLELNLWDYDEVIVPYGELDPGIDPFTGEGLPKSQEETGTDQADKLPWPSGLLPY